MLGIIGAMDQEVELIKADMADVSVMVRAGMEFCQGKLGGKPVVVVKSGIGKVNAGMCAQILADVYAVDGIINTGVAGSLCADINIGDIVLSTDAVQHDMDTSAIGYPVGQIPGMDTFAFTADKALADCAEACCRRVNPEIGVFRGRVVSGDQFIAGKAKKEWLISTFGGCCAEMEGAAIGQAAYLNNIPFLVIRAISDKADDSASMDYPEFQRQAIKHCSRLVKAIVEAL